MSRSKTLFNNTLIFTISNFASKVLGFLMLPFYTRVLTREEFGSSDLVILTVGLLIPLITISMSEGVLRFTLDEKEDNKQVFSFGLKLIGAGFILILMLYPLISMIMAIKEYIILFYLLYISQALNLYCNQFVRGINKIKLIGYVGVIQTIVTVLSNVILLAVCNFGIEGFLISIVLSNSIALLTLFFWGGLGKYISLFAPINKDLQREMLKYSIPLTPNRLSWWLNSSANKYIISGYSSIAELGLFSAASRIPSILITFQGIFIQAWQLSAIKEYDSKDSVDFFSNVYKLYNITMLMGCSLLIFFIKPISSFLFGPDFSTAWKLVPFLLVAVIFGALIGFLNSINHAVKKTKTLFMAVLSGASLGLLLNFIFVPKYGAMATSISTAVSFFTIWLIRLVDTQKYMRLKVSYLNDSISYLLVVSQAIIIITFDMPQATLYSGFCTVLIMVFNYKTLMLIAKFITQKINQIINNEK